MALIKEPREIDMIIQSEPWTDKELSDFRKLMAEQKAKRSKIDSKKKKRNMSSSIIPKD